MDFTFGIITNGEVSDRLDVVIESINQQKIAEQGHGYEIIVVDNSGEGLFGEHNSNVFHIPLSCGTRQWITKMKNLITEYASYENIVYLHDYIMLDANWYKGMLEFGNDWDLCMTKMINDDGSRFRDWVFWDHPVHCYPIENGKPRHRIKLPPYDNTETEYMYISGAYWIAKEHVMTAHPLDDELLWGQGEDLIWSKEFLPQKKYNYVMNVNSSVKLLKHKDAVAKEI